MENKWFEDKMLFEKWYGDFQKQQGERRITVKDMFEAYKAALQSERDKHRWIPVTERLPTEKDGDEFGDGLTYNVEVIGIINNSKRGRVVKYFINKYKFGYYNNNGFIELAVAKWQSLPE